jgi:protein-S-isoprenylcysteine O-methyltransferase Ste14
MQLPPTWTLGVFYAGSEILLSFLRRSHSTDQSRDRNSLRIIWFAICIAITASFYAANMFRFAHLHNPNLRRIGLLLFVVGILLRWYSIIWLGRFFTVNVAISAEHRVINSGPYRFVRHPSYTGALLAFVGFGLCVGNWISLLVLVIPITAAFLWRIRIEEEVLVDGLGEDYRRYASRTKRLVPFVY